MVKEGNTAVSALWRDLFSLGFYKRSQGRMARQVTAAVLAIVVLLAGYTLSDYMTGKVLPFTNLILIETPAGQEPSAEQLEAIKSRTALYDTINGYGRYLVPMAIVFGGFWLAFRAVNVPQFADFLIAVEAEMNKVSWPSRAEMFRSTIVVIVTIFGLAIVLFGYDLTWQVILRAIGVLPRLTQ
jgi:preprotein translocase subunit SecE